MAKKEAEFKHTMLSSLRTVTAQIAAVRQEKEALEQQVQQQREEAERPVQSLQQRPEVDGAAPAADATAPPPAISTFVYSRYSFPAAPTAGLFL
jgi:hypothetical protein